MVIHRIFLRGLNRVQRKNTILDKAIKQQREGKLQKASEISSLVIREDFLNLSYLFSPLLFLAVFNYMILKCKEKSNNQLQMFVLILILRFRYEDLY